MPISLELTGHLIPWSVNNYGSLLVDGIYTRMKMCYPFLLSEETYTVVVKYLSVLLFFITVGPSIIFIQSLEVLQTISAFVGFQVVEVMNKHIESETDTDVQSILEQEERRLHKISAKKILSQDVIDF
ncbi:unnamed protein product [Orchesella dallaii]|uniref:Uncharacterized protein n=1 Tax=Orchesella dallaii TaxID=48710 RepID=A0ABP1QIR1_9HEXA